MQNRDKVYFLFEGERNKIEYVHNTYFSEDQCESPEFKKTFTGLALNRHEYCGGGIFYTDKNEGLVKGRMAVVLEYKVSDENSEKVESCINASRKSGTVKPDSNSFAYNPPIISVKDLFSPENFLGYYVKKTNSNEMAFFSREDLIKAQTEESGLNYWCGFLKNLSVNDTPNAEEQKKADNTPTCHFF